MRTTGPGVQNHNLVFEVIKRDFLVIVLERRTEDIADRLALLWCVVNDLLTTRRNKLELTANGDGVVSHRLSGVTCRERQRQSCCHQRCCNSGR